MLYLRFRSGELYRYLDLNEAAGAAADRPIVDASG
jgi:hypothetical protein